MVWKLFLIELVVGCLWIIFRHRARRVVKKSDLETDRERVGKTELKIVVDNTNRE